MSALYLGFGMLNWMVKGTLIGGIYNRPIAIGNLMHFGVGAIALVKVISNIQTHLEIIIFLTVGYMIFAILLPMSLEQIQLKQKSRNKKLLPTPYKINC